MSTKLSLPELPVLIWWFATLELPFFENIEHWDPAFAKAESEEYLYKVRMLNLFCIIFVFY